MIMAEFKQLATSHLKKNVVVLYVKQYVSCLKIWFEYFGKWLIRRESIIL